jgi:hypothetical protein
VIPPQSIGRRPELAAMYYYAPHSSLAVSVPLGGVHHDLAPYWLSAPAS